MKDKPEDDKVQISRRAFLGTGAAAGAASIIPGSAAAAPQETAVTQEAVAGSSPRSDEQMAR